MQKKRFACTGFMWARVSFSLYRKEGKRGEKLCFPKRNSATAQGSIRQDGPCPAPAAAPSERPRATSPCVPTPERSAAAAVAPRSKLRHLYKLLMFSYPQTHSRCIKIKYTTYFSSLSGGHKSCLVNVFLNIKQKSPGDYPVILGVTTNVYCLQICSLQWLWKRKRRWLYSIKGINN